LHAAVTADKTAHSKIQRRYCSKLFDIFISQKEYSSAVGYALIR